MDSLFDDQGECLTISETKNNEMNENSTLNLSKIEEGVNVSVVIEETDSICEIIEQLSSLSLEDPPGSPAELNLSEGNLQHTSPSENSEIVAQSPTTSSYCSAENRLEETVSTQSSDSNENSSLSTSELEFSSLSEESTVKISSSHAKVRQLLTLLSEKTSLNGEDLTQIQGIMQVLANFEDKSAITSDILLPLLNVLVSIFQQEECQNVLDDLTELIRLSTFESLLGLLSNNDVNVQDMMSIFSFLQHLCTCFSDTYSEYLMDIMPLIEVESRNLIKNSRNVPENFGEGLERLLRAYLSGIRRPTKEEFYRNKKPQNDAPVCEFRRLPIFPEISDVRINTEEFSLKPNIIKGPYKNVEHYLDVHFRLIREDLIGSLRDCINCYLRSCGDQAVVCHSNKGIYKGVQILASKCSQDGIVHTLQLHPAAFENIEWNKCRKLLRGSIVCLSSDHFQTLLFATVLSRSVQSLQEGRIQVSFDDLDFQIKPFENVLYVMIECPAYLEAYRYSLFQLKNLNARNFPFQKYIVYVDKNSVSPPAYLKGNTQYNFKCLRHPERTETHISKFNAMVLRTDQWPTGKDLSLDDSQLSAIQLALTQEFSIIQGPPGTGKTYTGLKIVQVLLDNYKVWYEPDRSPILVVCYTNHALDQFMEGILPFCQSIARIGGGCESDKLQPYTVSNLKKQIYVSASTARVNQLYSTLTYLKYTITELRDLLEAVKINFIRVFNLLPYMNPTYVESFDPTNKTWGDGWDFDSIIEYWLGYRQEKYLQDIERENNATLAFITALLKSKSYASNSTEMTENKSLQSSNTKISILQGTSRESYGQQNGLQTSESESKFDMSFVKDVWELSLVQRWRLYRWWLTRCLQDKMDDLQSLTVAYNNIVQKINESRSFAIIEAVRGMKVVGMTTTGAAKYFQVIRELSPKILIVEEAAEVFEAHVASSLNESMQHIILLGDHQQLSPIPAVFELARRFNLGVSLFERMIRNGIAYVRLNVQHRMRPEISTLLVPDIYTDLQNHEDVIRYENIRGMVKNVHFLTHNYPEAPFQNGTSYVNRFESDFVVELCRYLRAQGYTPSEITVLSFYSAQVSKIADKMKMVPKMGEVRISTVDNFQGEENDIIVLSCVRSNRENVIGFLADHKRLCVALSRARKGLYAVGNFDIMTRSSALWAKTIAKLEKVGSFGPFFQICCPKHRNKVRNIWKPEDFEKFSPAGGCRRKCKFVYPCGHRCVLFCHPDNEIHSRSCQTRCQIECPFGHPCRNICHFGFDCDPCDVLVPKACPFCQVIYHVECWMDKVCECTGLSITAKVQTTRSY